MGPLPRVTIVGVPAVSGGIYVGGGGGGGGWWRVMVLLWKMYIGMVCEI